ncbi:MAG: SapC family protein [Pseudomonadota bacterium]
MSQTPSPSAPKLEGNMFLFTKPALLNIQQHGDMGVTRPQRPFGYAEHIRAVPLTVSEIAAASRHYPVIFTDDKTPQPLAVVGIIDDQNLFVDDAGNWEDNTYIPGYLRRYPFALANDKESGPDGPRMALIVDEAYEGIQSGSDMPFFENGNPSAAMEQAMDFCKNYEKDRMVTLQFATELAKHELLAEQVAQFTPDGAKDPMPFAKYTSIEEKKLQELDDEKFIARRKSNMLPVLYAHLMSMGNWRNLMERRARRYNLTGEAVLKPLPKS